jgi:hypothetical protein
MSAKEKNTSDVSAAHGSQLRTSARSKEQNALILSTTISFKGCDSVKRKLCTPKTTMYNKK